MESDTPKSSPLVGKGKCFNSLRTGRGMESSKEMVENAGEARMFQFPTNGKGHGKENMGTGTTVGDFMFQFPTNGKGHGKIK